jgi:hypothetical protein
MARLTGRERTLHATRRAPAHTPDLIGYTKPRDTIGGRRCFYSAHARMPCHAVAVACVLCGSADRPTDEDVIPKWLLRAFDVRGLVTVSSREESDKPRLVTKRYSPKLLLEGGLCRECNTVRLSRLERVVKPILEPMARDARTTVLDLDNQRLLAAWAIKTVYLVELAARQQFSGARRIEGYTPSVAEVGWLLDQLERRPAAQIEPPPRSMVWLACWDCEQQRVLNYAPSSAPLRAPTGGTVVGQFTTLALGFAAFQVFTVDYVEAELREAEIWNTRAPTSIRAALPRIWPHLLAADPVIWPPPAFSNAEFDRLASWDNALRRGST